LINKYFLFLILLFSIFFNTNIAFSEKWEVTVEGYLSGFKVGKSNARLDLNHSNYKLIVNSSTTGLTKILYPWKQKIIISGSISNNTLLPSLYSINDLREDNKSGHMNIIYENNYPVIKSALPNVENDTRREKVSKKLLFNTLDPVNSIISFGLISGLSNSCDHEIPVFDGRRRFNLKYTLIEKNNNIMKCKLTIIRLSGYSKKELKKHPKGGTILFKKLNNKTNFYFPSEVRIPLVIGSFFVKLNTNLILQ
jgi:hypothetical protein